ncbi:hypothetical protein EVB27_028 [Rhizobium phage RHph_TM16]|nr:hypothetical protein EVB27_028 [Rhizobium phage RHph_TM16]
MTNIFEKRRQGGSGRAGRVSEKRTSKLFGGKLTPSSGAIEGMKGDFKVKDFLFEHKSTKNDSLGLKFDWLAKINREARSTNKRPILSVEFTTEGGQPIPNGQWALVPMAWLKEVIDDLP